MNDRYRESSTSISSWAFDRTQEEITRLAFDDIPDDEEVSTELAAACLTDAFQGTKHRAVAVRAKEQGEAFRRRLEGRITGGQLRQHEETAAPDEVIHRRVEGRVVIQRRGGR